MFINSEMKISTFNSKMSIYLNHTLALYLNENLITSRPKKQKIKPSSVYDETIVTNKSEL